jgi:hypothetical protein
MRKSADGGVEGPGAVFCQRVLRGKLKITQCHEVESKFINKRDYKVLVVGAGHIQALHRELRKVVVVAGKSKTNKYMHF